MDGDQVHETVGSNFRNVKFDERGNMEKTAQMDNQNRLHQFTQWVLRNVMMWKDWNLQQHVVSSIPEATDQPAYIGKKEALKLEIQKLIEEQERIFSHQPTEISDPDTSTCDYEALSEFKLQLEQMTQEKQKEQQDQHAKLLEEKKIQHEKEMKDMLTNFNHVMNDKIRKDKDEILQWTSCPD